MWLRTDGWPLTRESPVTMDSKFSPATSFDTRDLSVIHPRHTFAKCRSLTSLLSTAIEEKVILEESLLREVYGA